MFVSSLAQQRGWLGGRKSNRSGYGLPVSFPVCLENTTDRPGLSPPDNTCTVQTHNREGA